MLQKACRPSAWNPDGRMAMDCGKRPCHNRSELSKAIRKKDKALYYDLGLVIGEFEIWRSIAQLDYHFFGKDGMLVLSIGGFCGREYAMQAERYRTGRALIKEYLL